MTVDTVIKRSGIRAKVAFILCLAMALWTAGIAEAAVVRVKADATGTNNGSSWTNAYNDLQTALAVAQAGDEIWVAAGTYKPTSGTDRTKSFVMMAGVGIYGGFTGVETAREGRDWQANGTILSGDIGASGNADNSYHVVVGGNNAVLDGFTITGGDATLFTGTSARGGGMYNYASSPTVTNCTFSGNSAYVSGGGL